MHSSNICYLEFNNTPDKIIFSGQMQKRIGEGDMKGGRTWVYFMNAGL